MRRVYASHHLLRRKRNNFSSLLVSQLGRRVSGYSTKEDDQVHPQELLKKCDGDDKIEEGKATAISDSSEGRFRIPSVLLDHMHKTNEGGKTPSVENYVEVKDDNFDAVVSETHIGIDHPALLSTLPKAETLKKEAPPKAAAAPPPKRAPPPRPRQPTKAETIEAPPKTAPLPPKPVAVAKAPVEPAATVDEPVPSPPSEKASKMASPPKRAPPPPKRVQPPPPRVEQPPKAEATSTDSLQQQNVELPSSVPSVEPKTEVIERQPSKSETSLKIESPPGTGMPPEKSDEPKFKVDEPLAPIASTTVKEPVEPPPELSQPVPKATEAYPPTAAPTQDAPPKSADPPTMKTVGPPSKKPVIADHASTTQIPPPKTSSPAFDLERKIEALPSKPVAPSTQYDKGLWVDGPLPGGNRSGEQSAPPPAPPPPPPRRPSSSSIKNKKLVENILKDTDAHYSPESDATKNTAVTPPLENSKGAIRENVQDFESVFFGDLSTIEAMPRRLYDNSNTEDGVRSSSGAIDALFHRKAPAASNIRSKLPGGQPMSVLEDGQRVPSLGGWAAEWKQKKPGNHSEKIEDEKLIEKKVASLSENDIVQQQETTKAEDKSATDNNLKQENDQDKVKLSQNDGENSSKNAKKNAIPEEQVMSRSLENTIAEAQKIIQSTSQKRQEGKNKNMKEEKLSVNDDEFSAPKFAPSENQPLSSSSTTTAAGSGKQEGENVFWLENFPNSFEELLDDRIMEIGQQEEEIGEEGEKEEESNTVPKFEIIPLSKNNDSSSPCICCARLTAPPHSVLQLTEMLNALVIQLEEQYETGTVVYITNSSRVVHPTKNKNNNVKQNHSIQQRPRSSFLQCEREERHLTSPARLEALDMKDRMLDRISTSKLHFVASGVDPVAIMNKEGESDDMSMKTPINNDWNGYESCDAFLGFGCEVALACRCVMVSRRQFQQHSASYSSSSSRSGGVFAFGFPDMKYGVFPSRHTIYRLIEIMGVVQTVTALSSMHLCDGKELIDRYFGSYDNVLVVIDDQAAATNGQSPMEVVTNKNKNIRGAKVSSSTSPSELFLLDGNIEDIIVHQPLHRDITIFRFLSKIHTLMAKKFAQHKLSVVDPERGLRRRNASAGRAAWRSNSPLSGIMGPSPSSSIFTTQQEYDNHVIWFYMVRAVTTLTLDMSKRECQELAAMAVDGQNVKARAGREGGSISMETMDLQLHRNPLTKTKNEAALGLERYQWLLMHRKILSTTTERREGGGKKESGVCEKVIIDNIEDLDQLLLVSEGEAENSSGQFHPCKRRVLLLPGKNSGSGGHRQKKEFSSSAERFLTLLSQVMTAASSENDKGNFPVSILSQLPYTCILIQSSPHQLPKQFVNLLASPSMKHCVFLQEALTSPSLGSLSRQHQPLWELSPLHRDCPQSAIEDAIGYLREQDNASCCIISHSYFPTQRGRSDTVSLADDDNDGDEQEGNEGKWQIVGLTPSERLFIETAQEACRMCADGVEMTAVDEALVRFGFSIGIFQFMDIVGIPRMQKILTAFEEFKKFQNEGEEKRNLTNLFEDLVMEADSSQGTSKLHRVIHNMAKEGFHGLQTKSGFYRYFKNSNQQMKKAQQQQKPSDSEVVTLEPNVVVTQNFLNQVPTVDEVVDRICVVMVNACCEMLPQAYFYPTQMNDVDVKQIAAGGNNNANEKSTFSSSVYQLQNLEDCDQLSVRLGFPAHEGGVLSHKLCYTPRCVANACFSNRRLRSQQPRGVGSSKKVSSPQQHRHALVTPSGQLARLVDRMAKLAQRYGPHLRPHPALLRLLSAEQRR